MTEVKTLVRIAVSCLLLSAVVAGQLLSRRQQLLAQRQKQVDQQQEMLEKQLLSQVTILNFPNQPTELDSSFGVTFSDG